MCCYVYGPVLIIKKYKNRKGKITFHSSLFSDSSRERGVRFHERLRRALFEFISFLVELTHKARPSSQNSSWSFRSLPSEIKLLGWTPESWPLHFPFFLQSLCRPPLYLPRCSLHATVSRSGFASNVLFVL